MAILTKAQALDHIVSENSRGGRCSEVIGISHNRTRTLVGDAGSPPNSLGEERMNYIGKFISNFKDFYNEINAATLTG